MALTAEPGSSRSGCLVSLTEPTPITGTIPAAANCGANCLDPIDMMIQLRNHHASGQQAMGVGEQGCVDMYDANIIELGSVNRANIHRAYELVSLLLRIDDCFYVKDIPKFHKQ